MSDHDEDPSAHAGPEDKWARRAIRTMQNRLETFERVQTSRYELMGRAIGEVRSEVRTGFRLLGYDVQKAAAMQAAGVANGPPRPIPREEPDSDGERPSHPVIDKLGDAAERLAEGADKLFEAAEAHTRPDAPRSLIETPSQRARAEQAKADQSLGAKIRRLREEVWMGVLVDIFKWPLLVGFGILLHYLWGLWQAHPILPP